MLDKIGRPVTVRIYGNVVNRWTHTDESGREFTTQYEIEYREYDTENMKLAGVGSEDFSPARLRKDTRHKGIFTWDGKTYRKDGKRKFEYRGMRIFRASDRDAVMEYYRKLYNAELVQLRY